MTSIPWAKEFPGNITVCDIKSHQQMEALQ